MSTNLTSTEDLAGLLNQLDGLKFDAGKSIRYHNHLRTGWLRADHWNKVITLFLGTSVAVSTIAEKPLIQIITGLATALFSSMDIVIGFAEKARTYDDLYRRWHDYLIDLETIKENQVTSDTVILMKQKRLQIERDEPGVFRLMERFSSAEEADALGRQKWDIWNINRFGKIWCRLLG